MKKFFLAALVIVSGLTLKAQNNDEGYDDLKGGFKQENIFVGGSIALGFGSGSFNVGANPEVGYSFAQFLDAGVSFNINYVSQKYYDLYSNDPIYRLSGTTYGGGPFVRIFPVRFLFFQAQYEHNWIKYKQKDYSSGLSLTYPTLNANSLLLGVGYTQRIIGQMSSSLSISMDVLKDKNSPYLDGYGNVQPIIRAGLDFYLKPSKAKRNTYKSYGRNM